MNVSSLHRLQTRGSLAWQLIKRDVVGRYRGSLLGILWSLLTPLFMLTVYTFVFGTIFKTRWTPANGTVSAEHSIAEFAVILFSGLVVYQLFSEVVTRAPGLVLANVNYVKKVVFPLEILPVVALGSAAFHALVSLAILIVFVPAVTGGLPLTALLLPVVLTPYFLLTLGCAWFLASLGVYFRDVSQFLGPIITALMFLSPILFPLTAIPEWLRPYVVLNPISVPVEQVRDVLIWGQMPDWSAFWMYALVASVIAVLGFVWFQKTRKGFADVV